MSGPALVSSAADAMANIHRFASDFRRNPALQARVTLAHDWYAVRGDDGWVFGFSKFVGYRDNNATRYLRMAQSGMNGGNTEARLRNWFAPVDLDSPLGRELHERLGEFLALRGRLPRKSIRINVLTSDLDKSGDAPSSAREASADFLSRISTDPRICGGRPCIKGTRMRVSDIVDMLAHGAERAEILGDFPYLAEEDIAAALAYAARATDHRVIRAA